MKSKDAEEQRKEPDRVVPYDALPRITHESIILEKSDIEAFKNITAVVRCKDCIYWDKGYTEECDNSDSVCFHNGWCKPDWFCADGERSGEDA